MARRTSCALLFVLCLAFWSAPAWAAEEAVFDSCVIVNAGDGKLTLIGPNGSQHTADVDPAAQITLDGKACRLQDLKKDMKAKVTAMKGDGKAIITKVEATSK